MANATTGSIVVVGALGDERVEPEAVEVGHERFERRRGVLVAARRGRPLRSRPTASASSALALSAPPSRSTMRASIGIVGGSSPSDGASAGDRVAVLRTADIAAAADLDVEQTGLAHAFEVGAYGVGVQSERFGDVGGGQRSRRPGQLEVDRVPGVVAERLEQVESWGDGTGVAAPTCADRVHARRLHGVRR